MSTNTTTIDPESIDGSFVPRRDDAVDVAFIDEEAILIDRFGGLHALNPAAALLWECFDGDVTLAELADEIASEVGVPARDVLADSIRIARELVERGIIVDASSAPDLDDDASATDLDGPEPAGSVAAPTSGPHVLAEPPNT